MNKQEINVEVAFATVEEQQVIPVVIKKDDTVQDVIIQSGILDMSFNIDLSVMTVGVFGNVCSLNQTLQEGDRVEIYRPLNISPMEARRNRAGGK